MAMTYQPVFAQAPKFNSVALTAANTATDGTGTIATLVTAGADGALVTHLGILSTATSVATAVRLFISLDGSTWQFIHPVLMAAFTVATTTAQTPTLIIDRLNPDAAYRLPANARLGVTEAVSTPLRVFAEWVNY